MSYVEKNEERQQFPNKRSVQMAVNQKNRSLSVFRNVNLTPKTHNDHDLNHLSLSNELFNIIELPRIPMSSWASRATVVPDTYDIFI